MGESPFGQPTVIGSGAPHEGARLAGVALLLAAACLASILLWATDHAMPFWLFFALGA
jgi:hypothetical protein